MNDATKEFLDGEIYCVCGRKFSFITSRSTIKCVVCLREYVAIEHGNIMQESVEGGEQEDGTDI